MTATAQRRSSQFLTEALESPGVVAAQIEANRDVAAQLGDRLRRHRPPLVRTIARGSSACAATYAGYLIETLVGIPVSAAALSIHSRYGAMVALDGCLGLSISQSGASPDLVAAARAVRAAGGLHVAFVNSEHSALGGVADQVVQLHAGTERSVAATKSFLASLAGMLQLASVWSDSNAIRELVARSAQQLNHAAHILWPDAVEALHNVDSVLIIARGYGLAVAQELALKLAEVCGIAALAYSSAQFEHGPIALVGDRTRVMILSQADATLPALANLAGRLLERGATVLQTGLRVRGTIRLPSAEEHPVLQPLLLVQSAYRLVADLAYARGRDPDAPPLLAKITQTT